MGNERRPLGEFLLDVKKNIECGVEDFKALPLKSVGDALLNRQALAIEMMASIYTEEIQIRADALKIEERKAAALERIAAALEKSKETKVVEAPRFDPNDRDEVFI